MKCVLFIMIATVFIAFNAGATSNEDGAYIQPSPEIDLENYKEFYWAEAVCSNININRKLTLDQILILGAAFGMTEIETRTKISLDAAKSIEVFNEDPSGYCRAIGKIFRSYDPDHLFRTGVTARD